MITMMLMVMIPVALVRTMMLMVTVMEMLVVLMTKAMMKMIVQLVAITAPIIWTAINDDADDR